MHRITELVDEIGKCNISIALVHAGILIPGKVQFDVPLPTPDLQTFIDGREYARNALDEALYDLDYRANGPTKEED